MTPRSEPEAEPVAPPPPSEAGLAIATCVAIAKQVSVTHARAYAATAASHRERIHTLGVIEDPTGYRVAGPQADHLAKIARAFYDFRVAIQAGQDHAASVRPDPFALEDDADADD